MPDGSPGNGRRFLGIAPYFVVDDVAASAAYYRDVLDFRFDRLWGEPPCFVIVGRDGVEIMLKSVGEPGHARPNRTAHRETSWDAYLWVRDLDGLYRELRARQAKVVREPETAVYQTARIRGRGLQRLRALFWRGHGGMRVRPGAACELDCGRSLVPAGLARAGKRRTVEWGI